MKVFCYLLPVLLCSGCSGLGIGSEEYGCRGLPPGSQCRSAREVYEHQGLVSETPLPEGAAPSYREAPAGTGHVAAAEYFGERLYRYPGDTVITVVNGYTDSEGLVHSGSAVLESLDNGYWYRMRELRHRRLRRRSQEFPSGSFFRKSAEPGAGKTGTPERRF